MSKPQMFTIAELIAELQTHKPDLIVGFAVIADDGNLAAFHMRPEVTFTEEGTRYLSLTAYADMETDE